MAINPSTAFPGKIDAPSAEYPYGKARNVTTPGDGTGTPFVDQLVNDTFGFQQALLDAPNPAIVPSGNPDEVGASQYLEAIQNLPAQVARVRMSAVQNIAISNNNKVAFDTVVYDPFSWFDTVGDKFVVPKTGLWRITARLIIPGEVGGAGGSLALVLDLNGTLDAVEDERFSEMRGLDDADLTLSGTTVMSLTAADTLEILIGNSTPIARDIGRDGGTPAPTVKEFTSWTEFTLEFVGT